MEILITAVVPFFIGPSISKGRNTIEGSSQTMKPSIICVVLLIEGIVAMRAAATSANLNQDKYLHQLLANKLATIEGADYETEQANAARDDDDNDSQLAFLMRAFFQGDPKRGHHVINNGVRKVLPNIIKEFLLLNKNYFSGLCLIQLAKQGHVSTSSTVDASYTRPLPPEVDQFIQKTAVYTPQGE